MQKNKDHHCCSVIPVALLAVVVFTLWIMCRKKQGSYARHYSAVYFTQILTTFNHDIPFIIEGLNVSATQHVEAVRQQKVDSEDRRVHINIERRQFTYLQLENMTNKFARVIGRGGFGVVYHGYLDDGTEVAVKICSLVSSQGTKQFLAEVKLL